MDNNYEYERQQYLISLAKIIEEEKLSPAQATQLLFGEIASWLMVLAKQGEVKIDVDQNCA